MPYLFFPLIGPSAASSLQCLTLGRNARPGKSMTRLQSVLLPQCQKSGRTKYLLKGSRSLFCMTLVPLVRNLPRLPSCPLDFSSMLLLVCNWPHYVGQNHFFVNMLFIRDSAIQKCSRRFSTICKSENLVPCQPFGRRVIPSGRPAVQCINCPEDITYRPNAHQTKASSVRTMWIPFWTFLCVEKLRTAPACIRPDDSAARPNDPQCSIKLQDFFQNTDMGRLLQPSKRRGFPSGRAHP
jgi:hypothetical protein